MNTEPRLKKWHLPLLFLLSVATTFILTRSKREANIPFQRSEGVIFGTTYHSTYQCDSSLAADIMVELNAVDGSLSMFNPKSTISRINKGETTETDSLLRTIVRLAMKVSEATDGAFDITVAPLVNAWGFGFKHDALPDSTTVDSLRNLVGWERIQLQGTQLMREDARMVIDLSAVAKGFGVDCVAQMFRRKGVKNFMIEIGGEVVTHGLNPNGKPWRVGVNKPQDDSLSVANDLEAVLSLSHHAMATSGNYRNYYINEGRKIAHTIDPKSGYPIQRSIVSSTVLAPTCAQADAYATAFMVLGLEQSIKVLEAHPELMAFLIYRQEDGTLGVWKSNRLEPFLVK